MRILWRRLLLLSALICPISVIRVLFLSNLELLKQKQPPCEQERLLILNQWQGTRDHLTIKSSDWVLLASLLWGGLKDVFEEILAGNDAQIDCVA